ncbi:MAG: HupE/UreJ family protein [Verrucomicrobiales bacterium]
MKKLCQLTANFDCAREHQILGGAKSSSVSRMRGILIVLLNFFVVGVSIQEAEAHAVGENYLFINVFEDHIEGHFEIPLIELRKELTQKVPKNLDKARRALAEYLAPVIKDFIRSHYSIAPLGGEPYEITFLREDLTPAVGGLAQMYFRIETGTTPDRLEVKNTLFFDSDRLHRGLLCLDHNSKTNRSYGGEYTALVFSPSNSEQVLDLVGVPGLLTEKEMRTAGLWGNFSCVFHLLFVFSFLVSSVLTRNGDGKWEPAQRFLSSLGRFLLLVLAYAAAHTLTYWLSINDKLYMSESLVLAVVALSVVLLAFLNLRAPQNLVGTVIIVFFLGAFHGLAIASSLDYLAVRLLDLEKMSRSYFWGFETGYFLLAAVLFGIFFVLRKRPFYQRLILRGGSAAAALIALIWFAALAIR